jgi:hypothetical protein
VPPNKLKQNSKGRGSSEEAVKNSAKQVQTLAKAQGPPRKQSSSSLRASRLGERIAFFYGISRSRLGMGSRSQTEAVMRLSEPRCAYLSRDR